MDSLSATATQDPEGFLGHPVNAFKLMKRLNTEWGDLESLVLSDTTDGTNKGDFFRITALHKLNILTLAFGLHSLYAPIVNFFLYVLQKNTPLKLLR